MVAIRIYVEGGGDRKDLQTRCRDGFRKLLERIVPRRGQLTIVACGSRDEAFKSFKLASEQPEPNTTYLLLVDAEEVIAKNRGPWRHLAIRDRWERPAAVADDSIHLMAVMTETWLLAGGDSRAMSPIRKAVSRPRGQARRRLGTLHGQPLERACSTEAPARQA